MLESRTLLSHCTRVIVKVGSSLLTDNGKRLDHDYIDSLTAQIQALRQMKKDVALVSSGAVAAGITVLSIARPDDIRLKQATAAVGQSRLMHAYERAFQSKGIHVAQLLVTHDDLANRRRFLNARNTLSGLLELDVLPVINENDTVVVDEIKCGDNDNLSAMVTTLLEADLLIILSDVGGLYDGDPRKISGAQRIPVVERIDARIEELAGGSSSGIGTGGMITKVEAAKRAGALGVPTVIADGREPEVLRKILAGEDLGTLFLPTDERLANRKHWIAYTLRPMGRLFLDEGCVAAVKERGTSLLPSGVKSIDGDFGRGDAVSLCAENGAEFARGLTEYGADEMRRILGKRTAEIERILGYKYTDEVVNRDDLVLLPTLKT